MKIYHHGLQTSADVDPGAVQFWEKVGWTTDAGDSAQKSEENPQPEAAVTPTVNSRGTATNPSDSRS